MNISPIKLGHGRKFRNDSRSSHIDPHFSLGTQPVLVGSTGATDRLPALPSDWAAPGMLPRPRFGETVDPRLQKI